MNEAVPGYSPLPSYNSSESYDYQPYSTPIMGNYVSNVDAIPELKLFEVWYKPIHGYLAAIVCVFGVIANVLNIIVLTRKNMQSSTNVLLTGLAISDGLTMVAYFPWSLIMYVIHGTEVNVDRDTYLCAEFQLGYAIFSVIIHSVSIWLTVTLAVFRYVFIRFPRRGAHWCTIQRAKLAVVLVVVAVGVVCLPNSVTYKIFEAPSYQFPNLVDSGVNGTVYWVDVKRDTQFNRFFQRFNFWVQAIFIRLLPCALLTLFSILLVKTMRDAEKRRKKLISKVNAKEGERTPTSGNSKRQRKSNRTTKMLLAVVGLFLLTETPQGIMNVLSVLIDKFFDRVYSPVGDLIDIITLINSGINFVLYCIMSKQFRDTFVRIFLRHLLKVDDRRLNSYMTTQATQATKDSDV